MASTSPYERAGSTSDGPDRHDARDPELESPAHRSIVYERPPDIEAGYNRRRSPVEEERTSDRQHVEEGDEVELLTEHPDHQSIPVRAGKREPTEHELAADQRSAEGE
jgi:hypothetical protein